MIIIQQPLRQNFSRHSSTMMKTQTSQSLMTRRVGEKKDLQMLLNTSLAMYMKPIGIKDSFVILSGKERTICLNAQRVSNGERPIGAKSLRLVVSSRDFDGNDYKRLWKFHEENGPALGSLFSSIGAMEAEIRRCPSRVLMEGDDLVRSQGDERPSSAVASGGGGGSSSSSSNGHSCSVCLESYRVGDKARTIPCFLTFHTGCIDPWLAERAECPICKHSAIG